MSEWGIAADIRAFIQFIVKAISDDAGNVSSKRVLSVSWGLSVLFVWVYTSVRSNPPALAAIPWEIAGVVFSLAGVTAAGRWGEKPPPQA